MREEGTPAQGVPPPLIWRLLPQPQQIRLLKESGKLARLRRGSVRHEAAPQQA